MCVGGRGRVGGGASVHQRVCGWERVHVLVSMRECVIGCEHPCQRANAQLCVKMRLSV